MTKKELIEKYVKKYVDKTDSWIAERILKENEIEPTTTVGSLRVAIYRFRKSLQDVNVLVEDESKWTVSNGHYHWKAKKGVINLSVQFIDKLFYEYSEHGLNLSQTQIINKHNLSVWEWSSIKNTLQLYKKSNIFSPYTVDNTDPGQLGEMIKAKIEKVFGSVGYQVEHQYNKQLNKKYKEVINKQAAEDLVIQSLINELVDSLPNVIAEIVPQLRVVEDSTDKVISIHIFDVHYGAETNRKSEYKYSPKIVDDYFSRIANIANSHNAKEVHVFFGGDNIETFTGLNHPDSWKGIAKGYYGSNVIIEGYKSYVKFLSQINNLHTVYAVPGNHDRATEKSQIDGEGYMAKILFELIKVSLKDINVKYDDEMISASIDNVHHLMSHGHLKLSESYGSDLILEYGDPYKFNLLTSGHWHNRKVKQDNKNFRQIVCPSLCPANDYARKLGKQSCPGFLITFNDGYNKPVIIDHPL